MGACSAKRCYEIFKRYTFLQENELILDGQETSKGTEDRQTLVARALRAIGMTEAEYVANKRTLNIKRNKAQPASLQDNGQEASERTEDTREPSFARVVEMTETEYVDIQRTQSASAGNIDSRYESPPFRGHTRAHSA